MLRIHFYPAALTAACLLISHRPAFGGDLQRTQPLIAVLQSEAGLFEKARACQQLGEFGTEEAIPALAALLGDDHLSAYARSGLEGIGGAKAAEALRVAAGRLHGNLLAGVVNSLGVLRDEQAIEILSNLARRPDSGAAVEALSALGRISSASAITFLQSALSNGPAELRPAAGAGCLLAAERQLTVGNPSQAQALYDAVLKAELPASYRLGATRGAILSRTANRVPFLIEQLRSADPVVRSAGLITIREICSDELASALNLELRRAKPGFQIPLLTALGDCHNQQSFEVLVENANSDDPEIRKTALTVLGKIGGPGVAEVLLKAVVLNRSPDEARIAQTGIEGIEGPTVDALVLKTLVSATDSGARIRLIRLVDARSVTNASPELLRQAAVQDAQTQIAAFEALKSLASANELHRLISLAKSSSADGVRRAAEGAISGACSRMGDAGANTVLAELKNANKAEDKNSWVRVLTSLGFAPALPTIERLLRENDESVANNTIEQLGQWPDPAPIEALFTEAEKGANPERRRNGLASAIRLARLAAEEHQRPDAVILGWFERAAAASATVAERRLIISGVGRLSCPESLRLLSSYLDHPELQAEAAVAILQIAPALAKSGGSIQLEQALEKIAATNQSGEIHDQATKIIKSLSGGKGLALFDGHSLQGWEGDTNIWRVRDGVIVGGSMAGNPRNEFLASTRSYTNFVLRLEYKLVGTEGFVNSGVQFHSTRVVQPPNEMSGYQADIGAGYSGCLYDESRRNKFLARPPEEQVKQLEHAGEWNRYEVRSEAARIQILLNGQRTVDYSEPDESIPHAGLIGLQIHGGAKSEVSFRNITIVELAP